MTKEEIINAVLNFEIISIESIKGYTVFNINLAGFEGAVVSVYSRGIIVIYDDGDMAYRYSVTPFEEIKSITYSAITTIE